MNKVAYFSAQPGVCWYRILLFVLAALVGTPASADRLYFTDGESIIGSLKSIDDGKLTWASPMLGDLVVEQFHVQFIETTDHFDLKTSGQKLTSCWMYIQKDQQYFQCDQGAVSLSSWKLVVAAGLTLTEPPPTLAQKGNIKVAAEDSSGNNNISKYNVDARSEWRYIESRHTFALLVQEESAESQKTRNMWRGSYQYDQFFTDQWFATGNAFYEEDEFRDIDQRTSVGLGMGYQFLETTYFDLTGKGTFNYVDEQFSIGVKRTRPAFLWNLDFAWRFNDKGMQMFHRHAILQSFDNGEDYEITTLTGLSYPINGHFSSVIQLQYDFDNLPADGNVDKEDRKWSVGLDYNW